MVLSGPLVDDVTLIDVAGTGELCASRADINVPLLIEHKVRSTKGPATPEHAA